MCIYPVQPVCTFLHIPAYIIIYYVYSILSCTLYYCTFYYFLRFILTFYCLLFFPYLYLCIFSYVWTSYNCTIHGADLTYISLLVIFCIIVYVTNNKSWIFWILCMIHECRGVAMGQAIAWGPVFWGGPRQLTIWTIRNVIINNIHVTWSNISASPLGGSLSRYAGCVFFSLVMRRPPFSNWHSTYSHIY